MVALFAWRATNGPQRMANSGPEVAAAIQASSSRVTIGSSSLTSKSQAMTFAGYRPMALPMTTDDSGQDLGDGPGEPETGPVVPVVVLRGAGR